MTKPSFAKSSVFFGFLTTKGSAIATAIHAVMRKAFRASVSWKHTAVNIGTRKNPASKSRRTPKVYLSIL